MKRFEPRPDQWVYTFGGNPPVMRLRPGEILQAFSEDAFGGQLRSTADRASERVHYPFLNPQTGPFFVEGAEPGDTLAVHLIRVKPARDWGVSTSVPLFGALVGTRLTANLQPELPERTWIYRVDNDVVVFQAGDSDYATRLPLTPFLGTLGVAPAAREVRNSLVPDSFGGNMDAPEVREGTTVFLGVNEPGALFSLGDGHYAMGEGEACGVAVEGAMETHLVVEVLKGKYCDWPRFETDDALMVAGSARPLEDAFRIAQTQLVRWIANETHLSVMDAYQLVSQSSRSPIANVCDPNYTVVAQMPKRYLPPAMTWMDGTHSRLREFAKKTTLGLA